MDTTTSDRTDEPQFAALWPLASRRKDTIAGAPRLTDLNGKVICEIWDGIFRGETIYPLVREYIRERFPDVKFVSSSEFGNFYGAREHAVLEELPARLKEHGIDAAIVGIGA